jgi:hypothetical protein
VQQHQQPLTGAVALIVTLPQPGPLPQNVATHATAANSLVHLKRNLNHPRRSITAIAPPYRNHLSYEDDPSLISHLVQRRHDVQRHRGIINNPSRHLPLRRHSQHQRGSGEHAQPPHHPKQPKTPPMLRHLATPSSLLFRQQKKQETAVTYFNTLGEVNQTT